MMCVLHSITIPLYYLVVNAYHVENVYKECNQVVSGSAVHTSLLNEVIVVERM